MFAYARRFPWEIYLVLDRNGTRRARPSRRATGGLAGKRCDRCRGALSGEARVRGRRARRPMKGVDDDGTSARPG